MHIYDIKIDGLVQDCTISSMLAMEIMQSCTKPSKWYPHIWNHFQNDLNVGYIHFCFLINSYLLFQKASLSMKWSTIEVPACITIFHLSFWIFCSIHKTLNQIIHSIFWKWLCGQSPPSDGVTSIFRPFDYPYIFGTSTTRINKLAFGKCVCNIRLVIFKGISQIDLFGIPRGSVLSWM